MQRWCHSGRSRSLIRVDFFTSYLRIAILEVRTLFGPPDWCARHPGTEDPHDMQHAQPATEPSPHPSPPRSDGASTASNPLAPLEDLDMDDVQEKLSEIDAQARGFIKRNPLVALAGAVTIGFLVGRLVSR